MPSLADYLLANTSGGNFGTMSPGEEAAAVTPGSVLDALARGAIGTGPSFAEKAAEQSRRDQAAYARGGVPEMMRDTQTAEDVASGFAGGALGIKAYHGSPYDFAKFDLGKIGTGEGAQAYGHGLYFAENPGVAADYKRKLAQPGNIRPDDEAIAAIKPKWDEIVGKLQAAREKSGGRMTDETSALQNHLDALNDHAIEDTVSRKPWLKEGRTYEVNINADPEHFLDWDKPLSEQSPKVQEAVKQLASHPYDDPMQWNAPQAYNWIAGKFGNEASGANALREAGIPGIKYLDQGSRETPYSVSTNLKPGDNTYLVHGPGNISHGEFDTREAALAFANKKSAEGQTHNYVVFDDKLIDILKKYGIAAGLIPAGAAALGKQQQ